MGDFVFEYNMHTYHRGWPHEAGLGRSTLSLVLLSTPTQGLVNAGPWPKMALEIIITTICLIQH